MRTNITMAHYLKALDSQKPKTTRSWCSILKEEKPQLSGTTLKVYAYLVSRGEPVGPREITRALGLSSPSLAYYHLRKLEELGFVRRESEGYIAIPGAKIEGFISLVRSLYQDSYSTQCSILDY